MDGQVRQGFIAVGANLGNRWATIQGALARLSSTPGISHLEASPLYETAPVGGVTQPDFLNLVVGVETTLAPEDLLTQLHAIEWTFGRNRAGEVRWGPRPLDLDLLVVAGETRRHLYLELPHPRMFSRPFVMIPLRALLARSAHYRAQDWPEMAGAAEAGGVTPWLPPSGTGSV